jgi:hypothetical protein
MKKSTEGVTFPRQARVKEVEMIILTCGCKRKVIHKPRPQAKFACPGAGHGYQLGWIRLESNTGWVVENEQGK